MTYADDGQTGAVKRFIKNTFSRRIDRARRLVEEYGGRIRGQDSRESNSLLFRALLNERVRKESLAPRLVSTSVYAMQAANTDHEYHAPRRVKYGRMSESTRSKNLRLIRQSTGSIDNGEFVICICFLALHVRRFEFLIFAPLSNGHGFSVARLVSRGEG